MIEWLVRALLCLDNAHRLVEGVLIRNRTVRKQAQRPGRAQREPGPSRVDGAAQAAGSRVTWCGGGDRGDSIAAGRAQPDQRRWRCRRDVQWVIAGASSLTSLRSTSGLRYRLLGHQIQRPTSRFSAVTSTERTTKVSSRTPKATAKPISVMKTSGSVPSAVKVPARTRPAEVITPPVAARPIRAPRRVPCRLDSSCTLVMRKML